MNMKKFLVISLALMGFAIDAWCCGPDVSTHNNYMFSVFRREMMFGNTYDDEFDLFWKNYTNGEAEQYHWNDEKIMEIAKGKGDTEMVEYLTQLNRYIEICDELKESWTYPTKEALSQRKIDLNNMVKKASAYKGKRLKDQWALLQMRANMVLGNNEANINYWKNTASKLPKTAYRTLMEDIYAGALLRTGKQAEACNIYADLGDMVSIKWALRKYRNLAGIQRIYDQDPNAACMSFLIQDFVNNAQETLDLSGNTYYPEYRTERLKEIDRKEILENEVNKFITYANGLVTSGKAKNPALWQAAIGELQFLYGHYPEAYATLDKAVTMDGTERMRDNARAIRLVASAKAHSLDAQYTKWLAGEMKWLIEKMKEENAKSPYSKDYSTEEDHNHYYDILDRLIYKEQAPKYRAAGRPDTATALIAMMNDDSRLFGVKRTSSDLESTWNSDYSNEGFACIDELTAEETVTYANFLRGSGGDPIEQMVRQYVPYNADFLNDLIGTKFLAENKFDKAKEYLSKVSLKFMEGQNISYYLANRDYTTAKWLKNQHESFVEANTDGPNMGKLTSNPKVNFCNEMMELQRKYAETAKSKRQQLAYDLATRYYQASYKGDCWYLTQYGSSVYDTARVDRPDFVQIAIDYLEESKLSTDLRLSEASYYALAFIPTDLWYEEEWSSDEAKYLFIPRTSARQYKALNELDNFTKTHKGQLSSFVTNCDMLKEFRKMKN